MNIVIPMAGLGSRFKNEGFKLPKPIIEVNGKTLIEHSVSTLGVEGKYIFITRRFEEEGYNQTLSKKLKELYSNSVEIILEEPTRGATETVLAAKEHINNDEPLIITNCDQITDWDSEDFTEFISNPNIDGVVVTYPSDNPKNSFAVIENGFITKMVEKQPVSDKALIGVHYWKRGSDFIYSAEKLINDFDENGRPECYISETYNYLIDKGLIIKNYHISENQYISLGTPYDLKIYEGKVKEFHTKKPKTIFCDIDGTILKHVHRFSDIVDTEPKLLNGVRDKINQWDSQGHRIILVTARKESGREITEKHLKQLGLCWDQLVMGVGGGERILINDKLNSNHKDRAYSVNVITNAGFDTIDWSEYEL
jgi:NDP-sugar pyrophosphorylase family protein